ncbi:FAD-dependent oxidoreductase domain-containing protein 1 [Strongylocentrotus purpuratus]|uniref:FAD-dependent oxidoreductase domain-containing protein 1 n=1 Tax=Strongylocentrotus purpuratus TaxID=7668 RepID=A0A7M7T4R1_STRPU|nr:FAD-dependent oxidoreductase domain-containing protein 1 [Strongylocentrotus purpuratus]
MSGLKRLPLLFKQPVRRASFMDKMSKDVRSKNPLKWTDYGDGLNASRPPKHADIVVIGGGVMGSSVAYFLRRQAQAGVSVCVVERDMSYTRASSALAVGGIRQQFSVPENIYMSLYSAHFLRNIKQYLCVDDRDPPDIQFNHQGYLTLASPDNAHILEENFKLQTELGAKLELLSSTGLKERFPWINNEGVEVGAYGLENEGWFDPYLLTRSFQQKAESLGAQYCRGEVIGFECNQVDKGMGVPGYYQGQGKRIKSVKVRMPNSPEVIDVNCAMAVVCAGSWSGEITSMLGIGQGSAEDLLDVPLPVEPRKRYVYVTHCPDGPGLDFPMIINLDGVYARREGLGGNYVMGSCPFPDQTEPDCDNLNVDYEFFEENIWPSLANRVPAFENLKLKSAWAGFYDYNTIDQNAIIGHHPAYPNLLLATGFSGHGIQQSPAVGQAISDLIFEGKFVEIDLARMGFERFISKRLVKEANIY